MFLIGIAAAFTHPTTCVIFGFSLMAVFGLRLLTSRFHLGPPLKELGPSLMSVGFGMIFGLSTWLIAPWGVTGSLADAALPPPYTKEVFFSRLSGWVGSLQPRDLRCPSSCSRSDGRSGARGGIARARTSSGRSRRCCCCRSSASSGSSRRPYPYYRFMNATMALFALGGLGAYVAIRWLWKREGAAKVVGRRGVAADRRLVRLHLDAGSRDLALGRPRQPVDRPADAHGARGRAGRRRERAGRPPDRVRRELRRHVPVLRVVEDVHERLAHRPARRRGEALDRRTSAASRTSSADQPTVLTDPTYNKMSQGLPARAHRPARGVHGPADRDPGPAVQRGHRRTRTCSIRRRTTS